MFFSLVLVLLCGNRFSYLSLFFPPTLWRTFFCIQCQRISMIYSMMEKASPDRPFGAVNHDSDTGGYETKLVLRTHKGNLMLK